MVLGLLSDTKWVEQQLSNHKRAYSTMWEPVVEYNKVLPSTFLCTHTWTWGYFLPPLHLRRIYFLVQNNSQITQIYLQITWLADTEMMHRYRLTEARRIAKKSYSGEFSCSESIVELLCTVWRRYFYSILRPLWLKWTDRKKPSEVVKSANQPTLSPPSESNTATWRKVRNQFSVVYSWRPEAFILARLDSLWNVFHNLETEEDPLSLSSFKYTNSNRVGPAQKEQNSRDNHRCLQHLSSERLKAHIACNWIWFALPSIS